MQANKAHSRSGVGDRPCQGADTSSETVKSRKADTQTAQTNRSVSEGLREGREMVNANDVRQKAANVVTKLGDKRRGGQGGSRGSKVIGVCVGKLMELGHGLHTMSEKAETVNRVGDQSLY